MKPVMNALHTRDLSHPGDESYKLEEDITDHSNEALLPAQQPYAGTYSPFYVSRLHFPLKIE